MAVLRIPGGIQTPAITRKPLNAAKSLEGETIYCRSMRGGQVSSVKANLRDLQDLLERCLRNRELNIGAFVRRHWEDLTREVATLQDTPQKALDELFGMGTSRFSQALLDQGLGQISRPGMLSVAVVWDSKLPDPESTTSTFTRMMMSHPHPSGWPVWMDPRDFHQHPYCRREVKNGAWEGLIAIPENHEEGRVFRHLDFSIWDFRTGLFYCGAYFDDLSMVGLQRTQMRGEQWLKGEQPPWLRRTIERRNIVRQVAECMFTAQQLVAGLFKNQPVAPPEHLYFKFMFDRLKGRLLDSYDGGIPSWPANKAEDESVPSNAQLRMDADKSQISERTHSVLRPLFARFGGEDLSQGKVDGWLRELWV
ncbi:MAG: hypothetical protein JSR64_10610 [Nitrospira sp.]|nr:hypothetical protein [Nitrospira sp.]